MFNSTRRFPHAGCHRWLVQQCAPGSVPAGAPNVHFPHRSQYSHLSRRERFAAAACRCWIHTAAIVLTLFLSGCAGYQLGAQSLFRPDIRTVHVPIFESDSLRRNLGERLTEAVVKEIERESTYKVVHDPAMADSVLTGRLISEGKAVLAENRNDEPRDIQVDMVVQVSWVDRRGESVMPTSSFTLAQQGFSVTQLSDFIPEAGQSISTAQQESISRIAKQIVAQMEAPW